MIPRGPPDPFLCFCVSILGIENFLVNGQPKPGFPGLTLGDLKFIVDLFVFGRHKQTHKAPPDAPQAWSPGIMCVFNLHHLSNRSGARRGPRTAKIQPKYRGRICPVILPKAPPTWKTGRPAGPMDMYETRPPERPNFIHIHRSDRPADRWICIYPGPILLSYSGKPLYHPASRPAWR